jgi:hypothetical protein
MVKEGINRGALQGSSEWGPCFVARFGTGAWNNPPDCTMQTTRAKPSCRYARELFLTCAIANAFIARLPPIFCFALLLELGRLRFSGLLEAEKTQQTINRLNISNIEFCLEWASKQLPSYRYPGRSGHVFRVSIFALFPALMWGHFHVPHPYGHSPPLLISFVRAGGNRTIGDAWHFMTPSGSSAQCNLLVLTATASH